MAFKLSIPETPTSKTGLSIGGESYYVILSYNTRKAGWVMDILDSEENPLVQGIGVYANQNLTYRRYWENRFEGDFWVFKTLDTVEPITLDNFGSDYWLIFLTNDEMDEANLER